jgi:ABC-type transport system substrate-binding protein
MSESGRGAGPFVPGVFVPGRRAAFTPFAGHIRGRPYLDQLEVLALGDREAVRAARASGRIDVALEQGDAPAHALLLLSIDPERAPFRSKEARAVVAGAIDRGELVTRLVPGGRPFATLLRSAPLPPDSPPRPPYPTAPPVLPHRVTLRVGREVPPLVSQRIVAHLLDLGLSVEAVTQSEPAGRPARAELRLFLFLPEVAEPGLILEELAALVPPVPEAREALESARSELDPARRRALLARAEEALLTEAVLIPLAGFPLAPRAVEGVHGLRVTPAGRLVLEDAWREP